MSHELGDVRSAPFHAVVVLMAIEELVRLKARTRPRVCWWRNEGLRRDHGARTTEKTSVPTTNQPLDGCVETEQVENSKQQPKLSTYFLIKRLTDSNLTNALTPLSGEAATGAQQGAFQLMTEFMGLMLDPFVDGRAGVGGAYGYALPFAPEREAVPKGRRRGVPRADIQVCQRNAAAQRAAQNLPTVPRDGET